MDPRGSSWATVPQRGSVLELLSLPLRPQLVPAVVAVGDRQCRGVADGAENLGNYVSDLIPVFACHLLPVSSHSEPSSFEKGQLKMKKKSLFAAG